MPDPQGTHNVPMQHHQYQHGQYQHGGHYGQYPYGQYGQYPYGQYGQYAPTFRPPSYVPRKPYYHPGSVRICTNKMAYLWLVDGRNFWVWITYVTRRTVNGYRWTGRRWVYFEADVNEVETFYCR